MLVSTIFPPKKLHFFYRPKIGWEKSLEPCIESCGARVKVHTNRANGLLQLESMKTLIGKTVLVVGILGAALIVRAQGLNSEDQRASGGSGRSGLAKAKATRPPALAPWSLRNLGQGLSLPRVEFGQPPRQLGGHSQRNIPFMITKLEEKIFRQRQQFESFLEIVSGADLTMAARGAGSLDTASADAASATQAALNEFLLKAFGMESAEGEQKAAGIRSHLVADILSYFLSQRAHGGSPSPLALVIENQTLAFFSEFKVFNQIGFDDEPIAVNKSAEKKIIFDWVSVAALVLLEKARVLAGHGEIDLKQKLLKHILGDLNEIGIEEANGIPLMQWSKKRKLKLAVRGSFVAAIHQILSKESYKYGYGERILPSALIGVLKKVDPKFFRKFAAQMNANPIQMVHLMSEERSRQESLDPRWKNQSDFLLAVGMGLVGTPNPNKCYLL